MADDFAFPPDLVAVASELCATRDAHTQLCSELPRNRDLPDFQTAARRWRDGDPPLGWAQQQADRERLLRRRVLTLAEQVHGHPFWDTLHGPTRVDARAALQRVAAPESEQTGAGANGPG